MQTRPGTPMQGFRQHRRVLLTPGEALLKQVIRVAPKAQGPQGPRRAFAEGEYFLGFLRVYSAKNACRDLGS
jgi:hypothetical protein